MGRSGRGAAVAAARDAGGGAGAAWRGMGATVLADDGKSPCAARRSPWSGEAAAAFSLSRGQPRTVVTDPTLATDLASSSPASLAAAPAPAQLLPPPPASSAFSRAAMAAALSGARSRTALTSAAPRQLGQPPVGAVRNHARRHPPR